MTAAPHHRDASHVRQCLLLAAAISICSAGFVPALGQEPRSGTQLAQVTVEEALSNTVQLRVRIADVFGDRLLAEDSTGRILVETADASEKPSSLEVGREILVEGRLRGRTVEARRITLVDGPQRSAEAMGSPSPPVASRSDGAGSPPPAGGADALLSALARPADPATIRTTLDMLGLSPAGAPIRHNKHTEILARDKRGKAWTASLDRFGRIEELELEDYEDDGVPSRPRFDEAEVVRIVEREGYRARAAVERRPDHFEVIALNRQGDIVEIHVDFAGVLYKIVWIR